MNYAIGVFKPFCVDGPEFRGLKRWKDSFTPVEKRQRGATSPDCEALG